MGFVRSAEVLNMIKEFEPINDYTRMYKQGLRFALLELKDVVASPAIKKKNILAIIDAYLDDLETFRMWGAKCTLIGKEWDKNGEITKYRIGKPYITPNLINAEHKINYLVDILQEVLGGKK